MFTDIVGYTALTQSDEKQALEVLERHNRLLRPFFAKYNGREVKTLGDAFLVEFGSALEATLCAIEIQKFLHDYNVSANYEWMIKLRIGVHLGDVVHKNGDVLGDAVNVASRIQALANPEGVCITEQVYYQIVNKIQYSIVRLENPDLKNVKISTGVYSILMPWDKVRQQEDRVIEAAVEGFNLDRKRIAILPFANMSPDTADEYFADGMTEELITTLSGLSELTVIARTSVMRYKNSSKGASEIGKELNCGSLIQGSVRKAGNRVRIAVQLIDAETEGQIWAQNYERPLDDIFSIQTEISEKVAEELRIRLLKSEKQRLVIKPTENTEAHDLYLRARYQWNTRSEEGVKTAIRYFEEAVKRDPDYTLALVGLADAYSTAAIFGYARPMTVFPRAKELAEKAIKSKVDSAEAHASMAEILMHYSYDWRSATRELERALQINPNYAVAHVWRSSCYAVLGQMEEAIVQSRRAQELDPFAVVVMNEVAKNLYYARAYDEAIKHFVHFISIEPDSAYLHKGLAETYLQRSAYQAAVRAIEEAITISKNSPFILDAAAAVYALANEQRKSRDLLAELDNLAKSNKFVPFYGRAAAYAALGEKRKGLEMLEMAYRERSWLAWIKVDPIFDSLRGEDEFHFLLRNMNLESEPKLSLPTTTELTPPMSNQDIFEFESDRSRIIFQQLASDFLKDYMLLNFMEEKSGWRSVAEIARETSIPISSLYAKVPASAPPFRELWKRGLIEMKISPGERGRGGEVTKIRIAYGKSPIRNYVDRLARVVKK